MLGTNGSGIVAQKKNLVSSYLKGIDNKQRPGQVTNSGGHTKMIGSSRNPALVAPAGTKNKIGGTNNHMNGLAVSASLGASIEDIQNQGINLNRTLGGTLASGGGRYF